jgi:predicted HicB family RNase H-like nuclease
MSKNKKPSSKGKPPMPEAAPRNLAQPAPGSLVTLNLRVPLEFHNRLRLHAARQGRGVNMTRLIIQATERLLAEQGG